MKKSPVAGPETVAIQKSSPGRWRWPMAVVLGLVGIGLGTAAWWQGRRATPAMALGVKDRPSGSVTFNKDVAPIVYKRCGVCHHQDQSAPFGLLTLADVREHGRQMVDVTRRRYMPPWLPEVGYGVFADERRLSDAEMAILEQWVREGAPEGDPADKPTAPVWVEGWQLGRPDLVVQLPQPYTLAADGKDVYRNFVLRLPLAVASYVKGVELRPGNSRVVHHAFVKVDATPQSRHLDEKDPEPGFGGMNSPAEMPSGQFLTWQPGKLPSMSPDGLAWRLAPGDDLVVQMHLRPSGKPELVQPSVGLYFTDIVPTNTCFKFSLCSLAIDIPAGEPRYEVRDDYVLPVDVDLLAVLPHAHYLGKEMRGFATLPNGQRRELLYIKQWDFNWQGDYRYAEPLYLPRGTTLSMRYTFDNSTNNVRNPNQPPQRVVYGPQSSDEMGELWFQVLPRRTNEFAVLAENFNAKMTQLFLVSLLHQVEVSPRDGTVHTRLGGILLGQGRKTEAWQHFHTAAQLEPENDAPHYYLGMMLWQQHRVGEARRELATVLRLNPLNGEAHGLLGLICTDTGDAAGAAAHFRSALQINPDDSKARECLEELQRIQAARGRPL